MKRIFLLLAIFICSITVCYAQDTLTIKGYILFFISKKDFKAKKSIDKRHEFFFITDDENTQMKKKTFKF